MQRGDNKWLAYEQQWKNLLIAAFKKEGSSLKCC
jgi:hypothetical protein